MTEADETISALIAAAEQLLAESGIESPRREARALLAHHLGLDSNDMRLRGPGLDFVRRVGPADADAFRVSVARRAAREPLAHITGKRGFWTLDLAVSDSTLIPRPDSEALIDCLLALRPDRAQPLRMLDLGTGTGALLLAALSEYRHGWGVGVDISPAACGLAAANAQGTGLAARCGFVCASWADAFTGAARFDIVLANPPYIPAGDIAGLMPEVARFEPVRALDGGPDGMQSYRRILARLPGLLSPDGLAILELGIGQFHDVLAAAREAGLAFAAIRPDLGGVDRALALKPRRAAAE